jgi:hypothetical protein
VHQLSLACAAYRLRSSGASSVSCFDELAEHGRIRCSLEDAEDHAKMEAMTSTLTLPREEILPAWRAVVLAYRANMRVTRHNDPV